MNSKNISKFITNCLYTSGDIAFRILDNMKKSTICSGDEFGHVTVCDINNSMLEVGEDRAQKVNIDEK